MHSTVQPGFTRSHANGKCAATGTSSLGPSVPRGLTTCDFEKEAGVEVNFFHFEKDTREDLDLN